MKYLPGWIITATILLQTMVPLQAQNIATTIKIQAMEMARAILEKDPNNLIPYLPPKLVEEAGGKEKLIAARDSLNKYMKQFGGEIRRVTIGNPGPIVKYKKQLQSTVPQTTQLKFMAALITLESTLVAISEDNGAHWYFVDNAIYGEQKIKSALPDLSPELVIPPMKKPVITSAEE
jgi:hypothetical protein